MAITKIRETQIKNISRTSETITQVSHGFSAQQVVYYDGDSWELAKADVVATAEALGVIESVTTDTFTIVYQGHIVNLTSLTAGEVYFLSDATAGLLTTTEPSDTNVSKPLLVALSTTAGVVNNWRGLIGGGGGGGTASVVKETITQSSHGFAAGDVIKHNGTIYVKAQADSESNARIVGIVESVDGDNFVVVYRGRITIGTATWTAGSVYYLSSSSAGATTTTAPADNIRVIFIATSTTSGVVLADFTGGGGGSASGESIKKTITQASHGFAAGDAIRYTGSAYAKAQADSATNAEAIGIVESVDGNDFVVVYCGYISTLSSLTAGDVYRLDETTAGALVNTSTPTGKIMKPMLIAVSTTAGIVLQMRGSLVGESVGMLTIEEITTSTKTVESGKAYIANYSGGTLTFTLPATVDQGFEFMILGSSSGGWELKSDASTSGQQVVAGDLVSVVSDGGSSVTFVQSNNQYSSVHLIAISSGVLEALTMTAYILTATARGYALGGYTGSVTAEIDGIQFSNESAINPSATLSVARCLTGSVNSNYKGYLLGGDTTGSGSVTSEIDGIQFSDESAINPSATLSVARSGSAGANSSTRGYAMGGYTGSASSEIDGIQFSDESAINPSAVLSVAAYSGTGVNSSTRGYAMGGYASSVTTEIDGIQFSDESAINPSATLSVARYWNAGVNSSTRGYSMGGYTGSVHQSEIDGIQFSDESAINPSAVLSVARSSPAGANSSTRGYAMGGATGTIYSLIDGIQFSNESQIVLAATLTVARYYVGGVQSGGIL